MFTHRYGLIIIDIDLVAACLCIPLNTMDIIGLSPVHFHVIECQTESFEFDWLAKVDS